MKFKQINFLAGLPRSGSTLVSVLLNQHPKIYASPHSSLLETMLNMRKTMLESEAVRFGLRLAHYQKLLWKLPYFHYDDIEKEIVIDKHFSWAHPDYHEVAKKFANPGRYIMCYRPVLDILASFVSKYTQDGSVFLKNFEKVDFYPKRYLTQNDAIAEYLMTNLDYMQIPMLGMAYAKQNEESGNFLFVSYNELVKNTQDEMNKVFDFIGVEKYELDLDHIKNPFVYMDEISFGFKGMHEVKTTIVKSSIKPEDLFTSYILDKYKNADKPWM